MVVLNLLILVVGFYALIKGADLFVDGSSALAKNFKVPGVIIGLTIVALGTSAPELAVSTSAALSGSNEIAISNVVGSNIFNLIVVLGVCAVIHSVPVDTIILKRDFPFTIIITLLVLFGTSFSSIANGSFLKMNMSDNAGNVTRALAILLLVIFVAYIVYLIIDAKRHPVQEEEIESQPVWKCFLLIVIGLVFIVAGGQAVVYSAKEIARAAGMTETLIGLTVVALGTSLPELVTSIVAAKKGETGMAVGNVVGSNLFNLMFILGVSSAIHPIGVNVASVFDMLILVVISLITYVFAITKKNINRVEGLIMVAMYIADVAFAIMR